MRNKRAYKKMCQRRDKCGIRLLPMPAYEPFYYAVRKPTIDPLPMGKSVRRMQEQGRIVRRDGSLVRDEPHKLSISPGENISNAARTAISLARYHHDIVTFEFNDIPVVANPDSTIADLVGFYSEESERRHQAYIASPEYKAQMELYERNGREQREKAEAAIAAAPKHMTLRDEPFWRSACETNNNAFGRAIAGFAERWACLMEARMAQGEKLATIADECSNLADTEGISGSMYGVAFSLLRQVWVHGEELQVWRNNR